MITLSKVITKDGISANTIGAISDHLGQFLILSINPNSNREIFEINSKNFREDNFLSDLTKMN